VSKRFALRVLFLILLSKHFTLEGPVSYLSIAALRSQRIRSYIKKVWALRAHILMQPNEFDALARRFVP
jgi:hypothetical protein